MFSSDKLEELTEDDPVVTFLRIVLQQVIGFPWYLLTNITASSSSLYTKQATSLIGNSRFLPTSTLFRPEESHLILASDIGIGLAACGLYAAGLRFGFSAVALLYVQPYMWVNHWIVAITYLHHTHPALPKCQPEAWSVLRGALATVDRDFGWVGKHLLHNIIEYHVIHHLFSRIPQYHADKQRAFLPAIWESFTRCQWVEPDDAADPKDRGYWYKGGPSAPTESRMGRKSWW